MMRWDGMGLRCDVIRLLSMLRDIYLQKKKPGVFLVSSDDLSCHEFICKFSFVLLCPWQCVRGVFTPEYTYMYVHVSGMKRTLARRTSRP